MIALSAFFVVSALATCGALARPDLGWDRDNAQLERQRQSEPANEFYGQDTDVVNGTCFCLRQKLQLREQANAQKPATQATKLGSECIRFNGRTTLKDGEVWYEMRLRDGMESGWIPAQHLEVAPEAACRSGKDATTVDQPRFAPGIVSQKCLQCICLQESNCQPVGCRMDVGSLSCGSFQIKEAYWIDCGKLGRDWQTCAKDQGCASQCVQNYMARYARHYRCPMDCEGFAREHNGGPNGCHNPATKKYWDQLQKKPGCRGVRGG